MNAVQRIKLPRILVAVCDCELRSLIKHAVEGVEECSSRSELRTTLGSLTGISTSKDFDLLIIEQRLLDQMSVNMIRPLQRRQRYPPLVLIYGWNNEPRLRIDGLMVARMLHKSTDVSKFRALIRALAPHQQTDRALTASSVRRSAR